MQLHPAQHRVGMLRRILKEERNYILQMIKKIRASGANVLLIQKSILRDAVTDLSLHYLVIALRSRCGQGARAQHGTAMNSTEGLL